MAETNDATVLGKRNDAEKWLYVERSFEFHSQNLNLKGPTLMLVGRELVQAIAD